MGSLIKNKNQTAKSVFVGIGKNAGHISLEEVVLGDLGNHDVKIEVKACGLSISQYDPAAISHVFSQANTIQRFGAGYDVAGIVLAVGENVTAFKEGDQVVGIVPLDYEQSGCSDLIILKDYDVVLKPTGISYVEAAGCIGDAVRAYVALQFVGRIRKSDSVLIMDGASSFGSMCIQLARNWGAKVLTTSSKEDEKQYLESLKVDIAKIIDLSQKNTTVKQAVMLETRNLGIDIVVDPLVSSENQKKKTALNLLPSKQEIISCLAIGGRWVTTNAELQLERPNTHVMYRRCASVCFLFEQPWILSSTADGMYKQIVAEILEQVSKQSIIPNIHYTVSFNEVLEAIRGLEEDSIGKVVMTT